jgi:hypothetical protein
MAITKCWIWVAVSELSHRSGESIASVWPRPETDVPFSLARRKIVSKHLGPVTSPTFGGAAKTTGEPPPPKVTGLEWDKTGPFCPDETVKFVATTSPSTATVTWEVAIDGGAFGTVEETARNTLEVPGVSGRKIVVRASLPSSFKKSDPVVWKTADLQINVPPGPNNGRYVITDEPRMPAITATAVFQGGAGTVTEWDVSASFRADDCPRGPNNLTTTFSFSQTGGNEITTDSFGDVVGGGSISFSAKGTVDGCTVSAFGGAGLVGTNPQRTDVQAEIQHQLRDLPEFAKTLQRIACKESKQCQFNAPPDGGTSYCPLFGPGGKVGIMQVPKPTADEVWNWRKNVEKGAETLRARVKAAEAYPSDVQKSAKFISLVSDYNKKRQAQGLDPLEKIVVPAFEKGDFNQHLGQFELDVIRGYDGWGKEEADRFGLGLHEFRIAVDDEGVLRVTDVDEGTLQGKAVWEPVPVADRHKGRPNYVNEVLAFWFDCTPATVPCNLTDIFPATQTLFVGSKEFKFLAEGTGSLANVHWEANGEAIPASGNGKTFATSWLKVGSWTVTATCGGTPKTATVRVVDVVIETDDDIVQVKSNHPLRTFTVRGRIKLISPPSTDPVTVILTSQDGRLSFPPDGTEKVIDLPANGGWKEFDIAGEKASKKIGDAKITVLDNRIDNVAEKEMTVFSFDQAQILVKKGGKNYRLDPAGTVYLYSIVGGADVSFSAKATLRPAGLDCTAPKIADLRIGIMQEVRNWLHTITWDTPRIKWKSNAQDKDTIEVETVRHWQQTLVSTVPVNDGVDKKAPLIDYTPDAVKRPIGCADGGVATSKSLSELFSVPKTHEQEFSNATVTWTRLVSATQAKDCRTFCVVFEQPSQKFCALSQARWTLNVRSNGRPANQHAKVLADNEAVSSDPATAPPIFKDAARNPPTVGAVGTARTVFTFDKKK